MQTNTTAENIINAEALYGSGAYNPVPIALVRGEGIRVWDANGAAYIDCSTGIGVSALGHAHPDLVSAISEQMQTLATAANGYFHNDIRAQLYKKLADIAPEGLTKTFLSNSGAEAIECALKLARLHTGKAGVVATMRAFHGRTLGALSATATPAYREPFAPLFEPFSHVPYGDVDALQNAITSEIGAVILEPVQGEAGVYPAPDGYLKSARELCDANGILLILDEIQSGMGRTGTWFAAEHDGVIADITCLAKALGGGMPIGATLAREHLMFEKGQHGSTFGGNPLACRASLEVIHVMERDGLLHNISETGAHFKAGLEALAAERPELIKEVRGRGLMLAVQMRGRAGKTLANLAGNGVLAVSSGSNIIRFLPPFIIQKSDVDDVLQRLEDSLE